MKALSGPSPAPFGASSAGVGVPLEVAVDGARSVGVDSPLARFFFADLDSDCAGRLLTAADMMILVTIVSQLKDSVVSQELRSVRIAA